MHGGHCGLSGKSAEKPELSRVLATCGMDFAAEGIFSTPPIFSFFPTFPSFLYRFLLFRVLEGELDEGK